MYIIPDKNKKIKIFKKMIKIGQESGAAIKTSRHTSILQL